MRLCCIFNYAPLYRESIYRKIDDTFDTQFCFYDMQSDIPKIDYSVFKKEPQILHEYYLLGKLLMVRGLLKYAIQQFDTYLMIGDFSFSYIPFLLLCRLKGKKVFAWGHGAKRFNGRFAFFSKLQYHLWNGYFCYGENGRNRLEQLGIPKSKLFVIYNSLVERVDPLKQESLDSTILKDHFNNVDPTILFVGRLTSVKKLDWIIDALALHLSKGIFYNVLIIGDGNERMKLERMVQELHLQNRVWFYGECYDDNKLNELIYNSSLCVSPGNVGLTALHAMEYGTPVLSHNDFETQMPEYETIIPGKTGQLYKCNDYNSFCDSIQEWINCNHDRKEIRENCYDMINGKFNSTYQIDLLKRVLKY